MIVVQPFSRGQPGYAAQVRCGVIEVYDWAKNGGRSLARLDLRAHVPDALLRLLAERVGGIGVPARGPVSAQPLRPDRMP